jgi:hypothetical protein
MPYGVLEQVPMQNLPQLGDLFLAVKQDNSLGGDKQEILALLQQLVAQVGGQASLSSLVMRGLGGALGALIARYFGFGAIGQAAGGLAGYGMSGALAKNMGVKSAPIGYRRIGG